jgi:glutaredoxin
MKRVVLFYSPECPHCPHARKLLEQYKADNPSFEYEEVNTFTEEGIDRGMSLKVMAVPSVVVDDKIELVGWPFSAEDIVRVTQ